MSDLFTAAKLRDRGMEIVLCNNEEWSRKALQMIPRLARQIGPFTGEQIRIELEECLGKIPKPNLMGAVINAALRRKLIAPTGRRVPMTEAKSHARKTDEYRAHD